MPDPNSRKLLSSGVYESGEGTDVATLNEPIRANFTTVALKGLTLNVVEKSVSMLGSHIAVRPKALLAGNPVLRSAPRQTGTTKVASPRSS